MPHTNNQNANARARKASRGNAPKFLQKKKASKGNAAGSTVDADGNPVEAPAAAMTAVDSGDRADKTALIAEYHTIKKQLASPALMPADKKRLLKRQKEIGGLEAYQAASVHGGDKARGGESGKWCVKQLQELKVGLDTKGKEKEKVEPTILEDGTKVWPKVKREKLRLLDVGAINGTSYSAWSWIDVTSIDLNSGAPHVIQCDFFDFPKPSQDKLFDVVGLSLVVNFEGSLTRRAEMIYHAHDYLKPTGLLYLVLPLPCLTNSRYCSHARLESILRSLGFAKVRQHDSAKLTYYLLERVDGGRGDGRSWKRKEVRKGVQRNNFAILVDEALAKKALKDAVPASDEVASEKVEEKEVEKGEKSSKEEPPATVATNDTSSRPAVDVPKKAKNAKIVWSDNDEDAAAEENDGEEWGGIEQDATMVNGVENVEEGGDEEEEWGGIDL